MNGGWELITTRVLLYGGTLTVFGLPTYLVLAPEAARLRLDRRRWYFRAVAFAGLAALVGTLVHLFLLTAAMNGVAVGQVDRDMATFVATEIPVGRAALVRAAASAILVVLALGRSGTARNLGCIVAGTVAIGSLAWNGHAMMNEGSTGWVHLVADQLHLLAAGTWLGALVALLALARVRGEDGALVRCEAFAGFSTLGTITVAALVLSGIVNTVMILVVPGGRPATGYLALLALKIVLFLGALALAAHNRFRLTPALAQDGVDARLRRSVAIELALVIGTILVVAALGLLSPG